MTWYWPGSVRDSIGVDPAPLFTLLGGRQLVASSILFLYLPNFALIGDQPVLRHPRNRLNNIIHITSREFDSPESPPALVIHETEKTAH